MTSPPYILELGPDDAEARFSPCRTFRYQLHRWVTAERRSPRSVVFVMLNPSTADAFRLDPTISKCRAFAERWKFDRLDVVNLYSFRTPHPRVLAAHVKEGLIRFPDGRDALEWAGCGTVNDAHIMAACARAELVIAAWGNDGQNGGITYDGRTRGEWVGQSLESEGIELHHLGTTDSGAPLHPLARGKSWIPLEREPVRWAP